MRLTLELQLTIRPISRENPAVSGDLFEHGWLGEVKSQGSGPAFSDFMFVALNRAI